MRITESSLRRIIRQEILRESMVDTTKNNTINSWKRQFTLYPKDTALHQDLVKAWDMMADMAPEITPTTKGSIADEISQETGLSRGLILFHLNGVQKLCADAQCPMGEEIYGMVKSDIDARTSREAERRAADDKLRVGGRIIRTASPRGMGSDRPTYGHTDIGTAYAPANLSDEEAVKWLEQKYGAAPMWKFEIYRDPDTNRLFAYYEIDTSG